MPRSTAIFRPPTPAEAELAGLRAELARLRLALSHRERALDDLRCHLLSFEGRYIRQVGKLYQQLDEWEKRIAALHPEREAALLDEIDDATHDSPAHPEPEAPAAPRDPRPGLTLRMVFRELALRIHPDHATDPADELRRTRLMAQANDAFRRKDLRILRRMLHGFDVDITARHTSAEQLAEDLADTRAALAATRQHLAAAEADHAALATSQLANLERDALAAALRGRDLLAEMAARVQGRIGIAMRQYDLDLSRIKRPSKGVPVESLLTAEQS